MQLHRVCCDIGWTSLADGKARGTHTHSIIFWSYSHPTLGDPGPRSPKPRDGHPLPKLPRPETSYPDNTLLNTRSLHLAHPRPWQPGAGSGAGEKVCASGRSHTYRPLLDEPLSMSFLHPTLHSSPNRLDRLAVPSRLLSAPEEDPTRPRDDGRDIQGPTSRRLAG